MTRMKFEVSDENHDAPTTVRRRMVLLASSAAVLLYLDRVCLSSCAEQMRLDLRIPKADLDNVLAAFFVTYALAQVPSGWVGDRFGARWTLAVYALLWSASTGLLAFANSLSVVLLLRLACGLFQAGAYPIAAGIVRRWVPAERRGFASSIVAVGGRFGGWLAPILTVQLMLLCSFGTGWLAVSADAEPLIDSWRPVMLIYGVVGVAFAVLFVWRFRDTPNVHPGVNSSELLLINDSAAPDGHRSHLSAGRPPLLSFLRSASLWASSFVQFAANLGWAFLVTKFPAYLSEVHHVAPQQQGWLQSIPLAAGVVGLFAGGVFTDWLTRLFGRRWGRSAALASSRIAVAVAFCFVPYVDGPMMATLCLAAVGFATDLGTPACWAFCQDVGGRNVASVMGWANMWGNFGAAASPKFFGWIISSSGPDPSLGWALAFVSCAIVNIVAAAIAMAVDARSLIRDEWGS